MKLPFNPLPSRPWKRSKDVDSRQWEVWFAWHPATKLDGQTVWLETVFRRVLNDYVDYDDWTRYEYTDEMGVLMYSDFDEQVSYNSASQRKVNI